VSPDRIHLIPNGVDTQLFAPDEGAAAVDEVPTILFIGRLSPQKNLPQLLEAVAHLETPVQLKLIGEGPLRHSLAAQAEQFGVRVDFLGVVPHQELPAHLQRATLFVLPSLAEGHPKVLIEAMSCGRPCVASDSDGNRQLIQHGKTGLLFDIGNTDSLTKAISELITDRALAQAVGQAARQYIKHHLDIYNLLQQEINLLQMVARTR
jgi:glycosyltransferase involved in cell wall biosynthesis